MFNHQIKIKYDKRNYTIGDDFIVNVFICDKNYVALSGISCNVNFGEVSQTVVTDDDGNANAIFPLDNTDNVVCAVTTVETDYYMSSTYETNINLAKTQTFITLNASQNTVAFGENVVLSAKITDEESNFISKGYVNFYEEDSFIDTVSLYNGESSISLSDLSVGTHNFKAVYVENEEYFKSDDAVISVNIEKQNTSINMLTGNIYQGWNIILQLTNSKGNAVTNKSVSIDVSTVDGSIKSTIYQRITDSEGKAYLTMNWAPCTVKYTISFEGDTQYKSITKYGTFVIQNPKIITKVASTIVSNPLDDKIPYRAWNDKYTDGNNNPLICGSSSALLASKSGSYNTPANIEKSNWDFNIPSSAKIKKIICTWKSKQGTESSNSACIDIPAGKVTLTGTGAGTLSGTGIKGGKNTYTTSTITWNNPNCNASNINNNMKLTLKHAANNSSNVGKFYVIGPKLSISYIPNQGSE